MLHALGARSNDRARVVVRLFVCKKNINACQPLVKCWHRPRDRTPSQRRTASRASGSANCTFCVGAWRRSNCTSRCRHSERSRRRAARSVLTTGARIRITIAIAAQSSLAKLCGRTTRERKSPRSLNLLPRRRRLRRTIGGRTNPHLVPARKPDLPVQLDTRRSRRCLSAKRRPQAAAF